MCPTEEAVKNGQSRDIDNIGYIRHRTKKQKKQPRIDKPKKKKTFH
jgi:hypothetical protein